MIYIIIIVAVMAYSCDLLRAIGLMKPAKIRTHRIVSDGFDPDRYRGDQR